MMILNQKNFGLQSLCESISALRQNTRHRVHPMLDPRSERSSSLGNMEYA